jgi:hypothetical protein
MKLVPCLGLLLTAAGLNPASTQAAPAAAPNSSALAGTRTNEKLSTPQRNSISVFRHDHHDEGVSPADILRWVWSPVERTRGGDVMARRLGECAA